MTQHNEVATSPSVASVNNERIQVVLEDMRLQSIAARPENQARIQQQFDQQFDQQSGKIQSKLGSGWNDLRDAFRMSFDKDFNLDARTRGVLLVALLYLVVPIDLIPDPIPVLGLADDVALIVYAIRFAKPEIERYHKF
jgi:uncharacterized membrane protein YkvA (DUF1232 family)